MEFADTIPSFGDTTPIPTVLLPLAIPDQFAQPDI